MENREQGSAMQSSESASKPTVSNTRRRTIDDERRWVTNNLSFFRKFTLAQPKLAPDLCYLSSGDIWIITFSHIFCIADRERVSERANKAAKAAKTLLFGSSEGREICFSLSLSPFLLQTTLLRFGKLRDLFALFKRRWWSMDRLRRPLRLLLRRRRVEIQILEASNGEQEVGRTSG